MHINIHLPWWVRRSPESARFLSGGRFFGDLVDELIKRPEVTLTVSKKPVRAQFYGPDTYCLNYHRSFTRKRNLNVKGAYLPDFFYVDQKGYSGWSEIASRTFDLSKIDEQEARTYYQDRLWNPFLKTGISKYPQPQFMPDLPKDYIFVPLQVPGDQVLKLAHFSQDELLKVLLDRPITPVVIKPHPMAVRDNPEYVQTVRRLHNPAKGIYVVDGHLHELIKAARVVVCTNSGAGVEAILLNRPVVTCGTADYHHLTNVVRNSEDLRDSVEAATAPPEDVMHRYAKWLFGHMFIDIRDDPTIWVDEVLRRVRVSAG